MLDPQDTGARWKEQYEGLSEFKVPGTAAICDVMADATVQLLAPLAMPPKRGRPSTKRKDNSFNMAKSKKRKKSKEDMAGSSKAGPSKSSKAAPAESKVISKATTKLNLKPKPKPKPKPKKK